MQPIDYFKNIRQEKRKYKQTMARANALPEDYRFVFDKIQHYMWNHAAGSGMDMLAIHRDLIDLFEQGAADGKNVLEITGSDVAGFCDELLKNATTYTGNWRENLNNDIMKKLGKKD